MEFLEVIETMEKAGLEVLTIRLSKTDAKAATEGREEVLSQTMVSVSSEGIEAQDLDPDKAFAKVIELQASVADTKAKHHAGRLTHWAEVKRRLTPEPSSEETEASEGETSKKTSAHKPAAKPSTGHKTASKKK